MKKIIICCLALFFTSAALACGPYGPGPVPYGPWCGTFPPYYYEYYEYGAPSPNVVNILIIEEKNNREELEGKIKEIIKKTRWRCKKEGNYYICQDP